MKQTFLAIMCVRAAWLLAAALSPLVVAESRAGLSWDKQSIELTSPLNAKVIRTVYGFTNTGKTPLTITAVKPSCGCVCTALSKQDYAPGESGEIKVTFDLTMDPFATLQKRTIEVTTSDTPQTPSVLRLEVHCPETLTVSPKITVWERGETPVEKDAIVQTGPGITLEKLTQITFNGNFVVQVKPEVQGKRYRVRITPKHTDSPAYASIQFSADSASFPRPATCQVNANIQ